MVTHYSNAMLDRIKRDPGLLAANATTSTWQNPPHRLVNVRLMALPETADIILIGSGITACSIVRTLLQLTKLLSRQPRITILKAQMLCSGASGRNGRHLRDSPFMYFGYLKEQFGLAAAKKMAAFRGSQIPEILSIAEVEGLHEAAEIMMMEGVDIVFEEGKWESTKEEVEDYKRLVKEAYGNRTSDEEEQEYIRLTNDTFPEILEAEEARRRFAAPKAVGALVYPAGSHSTYQLTAGVFSNLLNQFSDCLTIDTSTPVHSIACSPCSPTETSPYCFTVATPRGDVRARHVVHCTNSHAMHLIPGLRGKIFPAREHMTEHSFPVPERDDGLKRSWAFLWRKGFDYFIHRREGPSRDPAILLGGALAQSGDNGLDEFGVASDADEGIFISAYLRGLLPTIFTAQRHHDLRSSWTGILGWSADLLPWVGALPPSLTTRLPQCQGPTVDGCVEAWESVSGKEWIAAGYSGEEMTHAWGSGKAVAFELLGLYREARVKHWFLDEYRVTEKRVEEADVRKLKELY